MQYSPITTNERKEKMSQVSMRKGFWFYFEHQGHDISVHGSAWSGKETIYVDNHPVSDQRNLTSFTGTHDFTVDNNEYEVIIKVISIFKGSIEVSLKCNGQIVGKESKTMLEKRNGKKFAKELIVLMVAGAGVGYLIGRFIVPYLFD